MKAKKLMAILGKAIDTYGNIEVGVHKDDLWTGNGCFDICPVLEAKVENVMQADDDGGTKVDSRGYEVSKNTVVLR